MRVLAWCLFAFGLWIAKAGLETLTTGVFWYSHYRSYTGSAATGAGWFQLLAGVLFMLAPLAQRWDEERE